MSGLLLKARFFLHLFVEFAAFAVVEIAIVWFVLYLILSKWSEC